LGTLKGHKGAVLDVAFDPFGELLVTGSSDGTARCYDAKTLTLLSIMDEHCKAVTKVKGGAGPRESWPLGLSSHSLCAVFVHFPPIGLGQ